MTQEQARKILGVSSSDDIKIIKSKFRSLIKKYHPDTYGREKADKLLQHTKLLNEAYQILKSEDNKPNIFKKKTEKKKPKWNSPIINDIYTARTVFLKHRLFEDEHIHYSEVAYGKYMWNPELEEFDCLLQSLSQLTKNILENIEQKANISNTNSPDIKNLRFICQYNLFHILASEFINPIYVLKKSEKPVDINDKNQKIYRFDGFISAKRNESLYKNTKSISPNDTLYATTIKNNKLYISSKNNINLGHISLGNDYLYYVILPLLKNKNATIRLNVANIENKKVCRSSKLLVKINIFILIENEDYAIDYIKQNKKISNLLDRYCQKLKYYK